MTGPHDNMQWIRRGGALGVLVIGWLFIAWQNHFHITAPLVFVAIAYLAVVATIYNLWRTGAAAVDTDEDGDSTWAKPIGALGELEREKRTLLKAIKEAEFDHQMGKLSKRDADEMIGVYRARAIEVIKDIDRIGHGATGTAREQILREVRARLELEARSKKPDARQARADKAKDRSKAARDGTAAGISESKQVGEAADATTPAAVASETRGSGGDAPQEIGAVAAQAEREAAPDATPGATSDAALDASPGATPGSGADAKGTPARPVLDDEAMDADSTTTVEPARRDPAKEATP